jgi:hypothetical protein
MLKVTLRAVTLLSASAYAMGAATTQGHTSPAMQPWTYHADWSGGYSGWMSFPLAQDVGYDPSIYVGKEGGRSVLFHKFTAHGEVQPQFGMIRPLKFEAGPQTRMELRYRLKLAGTMSGVELILVGADGHRYAASLPSDEGEHKLVITAAALHLVAPTWIEAIVLRGRLQHPAAESESQWTLEDFLLQAERPRDFALLLPHTVQGVDGSLVATENVLPGKPLIVELASSAAGKTAAEISVFDAAGAPAGRQSFAPGIRQMSFGLGSNAKPGLWRAEVSRGGATTVFRFLVLGGMPSHGHLLLSQERLDQLSHEAQYAGLRQEIHRRTQLQASKIAYSAAAGDNISLMPSGDGISPAMAGQLQPYIELVEEYANTIAYASLDYRLNGDATSLNNARRALLAMAQWKTWVPVRFQSHGLSTYYEVGVIAQRVAFGYDLIADQLKPEDKERVEQALWKNAIQPAVQEYFLSNRNPIAASNWMANSVGGALAAAVATAGDTPGWSEREAPAIAQLELAFEELMQGLFPGDGSEAEPTGYENFAMQGISWGMTALSAMQMEPQGTDRMMAGFWWPYYNTVMPGTQLDTGDFDGHLKGLSGFAWGAEHGDNPALRSLYEKGTKLDLSQGATAGQNGHLLEELLGPIDLVCCSKPARSFDPPPPSRIFPGRGSAVLRSGWDKGSTVISLRAGPWFNHEHHDEGSFQVAAFGEKLIDEAGYASYYTDPRFVDYFTQAAGHNTLLIDGDAFSQSALSGRYWTAFKHPSFTASLLGTSFDYLSTDLTSAYDGRLQSYQREFFFLKPDILIVRDRVAASQPHVFSWLLHTPPGSHVTADIGSASIQTAHAAAYLTSAGANKTWTTQETPISIAVFKNLDRQHIDTPQQLVLTSPSQRACEFIIGMKLEAGTTNKPKLESWTQPAGEGLRTTEGDQSAVAFRTGSGALQIAEWSTDGSILASHGAEDHLNWMAIGAEYVMNGSQVVFHSSLPANVELSKSSGGTTVTLQTSAVSEVTILLTSAPVSVDVDGHSVTPVYRNQALSLNHLSAGEHHVAIR